MIDLARILTEAENLIAAIEAKSWHHSVNAAHACLCAMPSPAWAEREPGLAVYGPGEADLNRWVNRLRSHVMRTMEALTDPERSWESIDPWPRPVTLRHIVNSLTGRPIAQEAIDSSDTTA